MRHSVAVTMAFPEHSGPLSPEDAAFALRVRAGDHDAFIELVDRYFDAMERLAYRLLGSWDAAEEIAHETTVYLWEHRQSFLPNHTMRSYVLGATRHRVLRH